MKALISKQLGLSSGSEKTMGGAHKKSGLICQLINLHMFYSLLTLKGQIERLLLILSYTEIKSNWIFDKCG